MPKAGWGYAGRPVVCSSRVDWTLTDVKKKNRKRIPCVLI